MHWKDRAFDTSKDMDLHQAIGDIQDNLRAGNFKNENSVSNGVVLRLLQCLGWPVFNTQIVFPEFPLERTRVDYALCHPKLRPVVFVEVKTVGAGELGDRQLFAYAFHSGVPMAILTNGQEWHFYLPAEQGNYQERRVYKLDLLERTTEEIQKRLTRYLSYDWVCNGEAIEMARTDYRDIAKKREVQRELPRAWRSILEEPDELVVEVLAERVETVCGYKPTPDMVAEFLKNSLAPSIVPDLPERMTRRVPSKTEALRVELPATERSASANLNYTLSGKTHNVRSAREALIEILEALSARDPDFLPRFAARPKHGRKRRYVASNRAELYPGREDLSQDPNCSYQLKSGYWVGTNYSRGNIVIILKMACDVAGLSFGKDLILNFT